MTALNVTALEPVPGIWSCVITHLIEHAIFFGPNSIALFAIDHGKYVNSILITGGAGFIGVHSAQYFHKLGWAIFILDNLSRRGTPENLEWLKTTCAMRFIRADVRDSDAMERIVHEIQPDILLHLAGQV